MDKYGDEIEEIRQHVQDVVGTVIAAAVREAVRLGKSVTPEAEKWWTSRYVKSIFFAIVANKKGQDELDTAAKTVLPAVAMVLGRAAAYIADHEGKKVIDTEHAARASVIVDCPALSDREGDEIGIRAEWCN